MEKYKKFWKLIVKLIKEKDVFHHASAITFNLFICAIPFTLLLFAIIGYVLSYQDAFNEIIRYGHQLFPQFTYQSNSNDVFRGAITLETLLRPLIQARRVFGIVGTVILIFFSQGLFHTIKHVVFEVFDIKDRKHPLMEMIHNFFTFGLIGAAFIFFSLSISILSVLSLNQVKLPLLDRVIKLGWLYPVLKIVVPILFTFFIFYVLFRYISEKRMTPRVALVGAFIYTTLFEIAKFGVGWYLGYAFRAYRYFYQGYALLVIVGVWGFYSAVLLVITTIIARSYQDVFTRKPLKENPYTSIS